MAILRWVALVPASFALALWVFGPELAGPVWVGWFFLVVLKREAVADWWAKRRRRLRDSR